MSETGESPKGNWLSRIMRRDTGPHPEKLKAEAEAKARETVTMFSNSETQEVKVEYHPNGENTFDIDKQSPSKGTIIRVKNDFKYAFSDDVYFYYVIAKGGPDYHVWEMGSNERDITDPEFKVKSFELHSLDNLSKHEFLVEDTLDVFAHMPEEVATVERIDVMWGGLTEKSKDPVKSPEDAIPVFKPGLSPNPQTT